MTFSFPLVLSRRRGYSPLPTVIAAAARAFEARSGRWTRRFRTFFRPWPSAACPAGSARNAAGGAPVRDPQVVKFRKTCGGAKPRPAQYNDRSTSDESFNF
jgi:hypothetical protein